MGRNVTGTLDHGCDVYHSLRRAKCVTWQVCLRMVGIFYVFSDEHGVKASAHCGMYVMKQNVWWSKAERKINVEVCN